MDLRQVAKGAPYYLVTEIGSCPLWRFWVVLLDNGMEVYQTMDEPAFSECNPWIRLKQFLKDHNLKIASMAFARKDFSQMAQINLKSQADGYFYSRRMRKMLAGDPAFSGYEDQAQGFGELVGDKLTIHWVETTSEGRVTTEVRDLATINKKHSEPIGLIRN